MQKRNGKDYAHPRTRHGAILVLTALTMVIVLAMVAFGIDIGYIAVAKTQLQNAADAAALAGTRECPNGPEAVREAAKEVALSNKSGGHLVSLFDQDIELGRWEVKSAEFIALSGDAESRANAVRVTCHLSESRGTPLNLFFAPILGIRTSRVTTQATAAGNFRCGLIIGIPKVTMSGGSHTDSYNSDEAPYQAATAGHNGHVCSNGNITMSGPSVIDGNAHPGPGRVVTNSGPSHVTGRVEALIKPLNYPPANPGNAATVNDNKRIPRSDMGKVLLNSKQEFVMSGGDSVTLKPGTYYFSKLTLSGGSTIRVTGPTVIYCTGDCMMSGSSLTNLTRVPKNLQLFPMGSKCVVSGSSEFYGVVYGPTTKVERSGSSDYFGSIIAGELVLSGSGGIHADEALAFDYLSGNSRRTKLVQ